MDRRSRTIGAVATLAVAVVLVASACSIPLGGLGGPTSAAFGINEAGVIVGASELPGSTPDARIERAFTRRPDGTMTELATPPGTTSSAAYAVNDAGTIAGTVTIEGVSGTHSVQLARWDPDGSFHDLGSLGSDGVTIRAIDPAGRIIGYVDRADGSRAFVHDPAVGHLALLPLLPDARHTFALGMNDVGDVVGYQWVGANPPVAHAVRWDLDAGTVTDLTLAWGLLLPIDINDAGAIIGQAKFPGTTPYNGTVQAVILRPGDLEPEPLGAGTYAFAVSINDDGVVAGYRTEGGPRAFRWSESTGAETLSTTESYAWDINDRGQIVGVDGPQAAIFVAVPAP